MADGMLVLLRFHGLLPTIPTIQYSKPDSTVRISRECPRGCSIKIGVYKLSIGEDVALYAPKSGLTASWQCI